MTQEHELIIARIALELPRHLPIQQSTAFLAQTAVQTYHLIRQLLPTVQFQTHTLFTFEEGVDGCLELFAEDVEAGGRASCPAAHVAALFATDQAHIPRTAPEQEAWSSTAPWHEPIEVRTNQVSLQLYTLAHTAKLAGEPGSVFEENAQQAQDLARASLTLPVSEREGRWLN